MAHCTNASHTAQQGFRTSQPVRECQPTRSRPGQDSHNKTTEYVRQLAKQMERWRDGEWARE